MSILDASGSVACAECGRKARDERDRLEAENAKLRELVKQMYPIAKAYLQFGVMLGRIDGMSYDWALQMIELGVEVDE